jgi:hypothetical protein
LECCAACNRDMRCRGWTFVRGGHCWRKLPGWGTAHVPHVGGAAAASAVVSGERCAGCGLGRGGWSAAEPGGGGRQQLAPPPPAAVSATAGPSSGEPCYRGYGSPAGFDIAGGYHDHVDEDGCCRACNELPECRAWAYDGTCWRKSRLGAAAVASFLAGRFD